jgi:hypothetical protein
MSRRARKDWLAKWERVCKLMGQLGQFALAVQAVWRLFENLHKILP